MEFFTQKYNKSRDPLIGTIRGEIETAVGRVVELKTGEMVTGNGDGAASSFYIGLVATHNRWRIVGVGGWAAVSGLATTAEVCQWGFNLSDLGADGDAFGQVTMDTTAGKNWAQGDIIYQGISPFEDYFGFDALANGGADTWDISGTGAGVMMGDWQSKSALLMFTKANVANSDAQFIPFMLVEYETEGGVI